MEIDSLWIWISVVSYVVTFITFLRKKEVKIHRAVQLIVIITLGVILPVVIGLLLLEYEPSFKSFNDVQKGFLFAGTICINAIGLCLLSLLGIAVSKIKDWLCGKGDDLF